MKKGILVMVIPNLTTDPYNKRGEIGIVTDVDFENEIAVVEFKDLTLGKYYFDTLKIQ